MRVSYSGISTYQNCPYQYKLQYVEGRPTEQTPALSFGSSVHAAMEWLYSPPTPDPPAVEELVGRLETEWISEGYGTPAEEARYFYQAKSALEQYYRRYVENNPDGFRLPAALEYRFRIDLGFCELSGVIDRVDRTDDGFEIIDYKTNRRLPPAKRLEEDLQLPLYRIAAEHIWDIPVAKVSFHYLLIDHRYSMYISDRRAEEALDVVRSVVREIEAERFSPTRNNLCPWCDFLNECPLMAGKVKSRKGGAASPFIDVGQAVDELLTTHRQVSLKLSRVEGLKQIVCDYLDKHGLSEASGSLGTASYDADGTLEWHFAE